MEKKIDFIKRELLYNGHLQALGSVGIVYISSFINLSRPISLPAALIVYLTFQIVFLFDRYKDRVKDKVTNKIRSEHLESYAARVPLIIALMAISTVFLLLTYANIQTLIFTLVILILGILYPIYFKGLTKYIFMFKNFYVGGVYGVLAYFPFIYNATLPSFNFLYLFIIFATYTIIEGFISQIILDTKDIESDAKYKLKTLSVVIGRNKAIVTANVIALIAELALISLTILNGWRTIILLLILVNFVTNVFVNTYLAKKDINAYFLSAAKFTVWLLLALAYHLL